MSVVLPVLAFLVLIVWMANSVGRSWRLRAVERDRERRLYEIELKQHILRAERARLQAEENGLVTYADAAKWLPPDVVRVVDLTRPCPITRADHRWVLTEVSEIASAGYATPVRIDETWTCSSCGDTTTARPERTRP